MCVFKIGYYHLYAKDPSVVKGTPFADLGSVFEGAWPRIMQAVQKAATYGIGVLIGWLILCTGLRRKILI
jgi:hypothetical protein